MEGLREPVGPKDPRLTATVLWDCRFTRGWSVDGHRDVSEQEIRREMHRRNPQHRHPAAGDQAPSGRVRCGPGWSAGTGGENSWPCA